VESRRVRSDDRQDVESRRVRSDDRQDVESRRDSSGSVAVAGVVDRGPAVDRPLPPSPSRDFLSSHAVASCTVAGDSSEPGTDAAVQELFYRHDRVPLVYWRQLSGAKTAVLLTGAVAVLSFVTGLSHLSQGTALTFDGPLAPLVPAGSGVVRLAGVLLGFAHAVVTVGLQRRKRLAWYGAVVTLPLAALLPLVTAEPTDVLLFFVPLVALPLVVRNRSTFDRSLDLSPLQIAALTSFVGVQVYGTVGTYVLQEQYNGIETWTDAFYYIVVTGTTVGYGDATPASADAKLFTLSVLIFGTAAFTVAFGSLIVPAIESRMTAAFGHMTASELTLLEDHVLVLGHGDFTEPLLDELEETTDVVVVTPDTDEASALANRDVNVLTGDPTDEEVLLDAGIESASGVVAATHDDARDALAILAARRANPDVRVVAAASDQRHVEKLRDVGADTVISPTVIGGRLLGRSIAGETDPLVDEWSDEAAGPDDESDSDSGDAPPDA
jgi:voltage-gated potassium channel